MPLLQTLPDIAGQTLTVDALLTQRKLARYLLEREAHYVFTAKGNQKLLLEDIALWFDTAAPRPPDFEEYAAAKPKFPRFFSFCAAQRIDLQEQMRLG